MTEPPIRVLMAALVALAVGLTAGNALAQSGPTLRPGAIVAPEARDDAAASARALAPDIAARPVWKRITLGTHKRIGALRVAFDLAGVRVGDSADEILGRPAFALSAVPTDVDLVVASVAELGFANSASLADIYWRAGELGLELCPAEVAPLLRLHYLAQPVGEFLNIAMRPIATYGGEPIALSVVNAGTGPLLIGGDGRLDLVINHRARFVFVRPQRIALPDMR